MILNNKLNFENKIFESSFDMSFLKETKDMQCLRDLALKKFKSMNFPDKNDFLYSFIDIRKLFQLSFKNHFDNPIIKKLSKIKNTLEKKLFTNNYITFINGTHYPNLSKIAHSSQFNITLCLLKESLQEEKNKFYLLSLINEEKDIFSLVNYIFSDSSYILKFNGSLKEEIQIFFFFENSAYSIEDLKNLWMKHFHLSFIFSEKSYFRLVIHFLPDDQSNERISIFQNWVENFILERNSNIEICFIQEKNLNFYHNEKINIFLYKESLFRYHSFLKGSIFFRKIFFVQLKEKKAEILFNNLTIALNSSDQNNEIHQILDFEHLDKETFSYQKIKNLIDGKTHCSLSSNIFIHPNANNSSSSQVINNILLSDESKISNRPNLNIHVDEVKCTHGSTIGYIRQDWIFYLRSRGLSKPIAKQIILEGFCSEVIDPLEPNIKNYLINNFKWGKIYGY